MSKIIPNLIVSKQRNKRLVAIFCASSILLFMPLLSTNHVHGHISRAFGEYTIEIGWTNEPVYVGLKNSILIEVNQGSGESEKPVINALKDLQISIKYGTVTKPLDFLPSSMEDGQYYASLIPTRQGSYSLVIKGFIQGQSVDAEIPLDDVTSIDELNFPQPGTSSNFSVNMTQLDPVITKLTKDVVETNMKTSIASNNLLEAAKSFQAIKNNTDILYMLSTLGIGIGASAIVIAVMTIRKNKQ